MYANRGHFEKGPDGGPDGGHVPLRGHDGDMYLGYVFPFFYARSFKLVPLLLGISPFPFVFLWMRKLPGFRRKEATMFQDALFVSERVFGGQGRWRCRPAALVHAVALALLVTVPLLRVGELPMVDVFNVIVVPALPATPLPRRRRGRESQAHASTGSVAVAATAEVWRVAPVAVPEGIVEEGGFGAGGEEGGIDGGVDYGMEGGIARESHRRRTL